MLESLLASEGPQLITWLETTLQNLISKQKGEPLPLRDPEVSTLNPVVQSFLNFAVGLLETLVAEGGPSVITWIQAELAALQKKYGSGTPIAATPHPVAGVVNPHLS